MTRVGSSRPWFATDLNLAIIIQPKIPFLGVIFDEDHDFEALRVPEPQKLTLIPY